MILCCGEALIDLLPRDGPNGERLFQPFPGGSVFNVAIALGRLGAAAGFFSGLSTDFFGATLRETLQASNVDTGLVNWSERPTTLAFVTLEAGQARYAFFDEGSAGRMLTENDLPALPVDIRALHFGSFSLAEEPCGSAYEALMQRESRERVISLDPNVRPTLIRNREAYIERIERMVAMADIVKLSNDDLTWLAPDGRFEEFAARWLERGARLVILTRGAEGASAQTARLRADVPAVRVKIADTIGAGDTFSAGVLARLAALGALTKERIAALSESELTDILGFAAKAAAVTASRPGADPPWLRELA